MAIHATQSGNLPAVLRTQEYRGKQVMTKSAFLEAYAIQLTKLYDWARNEEKLARFLRGCIATIREGRSEWNHDGPAVVAA